MHRHRGALRQGSFDLPMGSVGAIVEVDETYFGKQAGHAKASSRFALGVNDFERATLRLASRAND